MNASSGSRVQWENLPDAVRSAVEQILGDSVISTRSQSGGYSPGSADRIVTANGTTAFVKAVGKELNQTSPRLHRREASIMTRLPEGLPHPGFLGSHDDDGWVALVFEDANGSHPRLPWDSDELVRSLDAVHAYAQAPLDSELQDLLPPLGNQRFYTFQGWERLREEPLVTLDPWANANLDVLADLSAEAASAVAGDQLVHGDLRADNMLLDSDGTVMVVDWPWAARGASWFDALGLLVDVLVHDPQHDVEAMVNGHEVLSPATPEQINAVLSGLTGYFLDAARQPAPQGITTLRAFQQAEGIAALGWLRERIV